MKNTLRLQVVYRYYVKNGVPNTIYSELHFCLIIGSKWAIKKRNDHDFVGRWIIKYKN